MSGCTPIDLAQLRIRLAEAKGPRFWRSLDEAMDSPDLQHFLTAEFPSAAPLLTEANRREVLKAMAASLLLGGLAACGQPSEDIIPYVEAPERTVPGQPSFYATAVPFEGYAQPVLGEVHEGRPTRLTGNPDHPASSSAADVFTQAAILQLYDPDRSQTIRFRNEVATWNDVQSAMVAWAGALAATGGAGFRLLTGNVGSPTLLRQIAALQAKLPEMRWHVHEPVGNALAYQATALAFGAALETHPRLENAHHLLCLDADPFGPGPRQMLHGRAWSEARRAAREAGRIVDLHVAESAPSLTGASATSRLAVASHRILHLLIALAGQLGMDGGGPQEALSAAERDWIARQAHALAAARGRSLLLVGAHQPAEIQALGLRINAALGTIGQTLLFTDPIIAHPLDPENSLQALARDMDAGHVRGLLVLGSNPVQTAPADIPFGRLMERVELRMHLGLHDDETGAHCQWHLPQTHPLESWGDARGADGTVTILQPLVRPLYHGVSVHRVLATLMGDLDASDRDIVRASWTDALGPDFEAGWRRALHDGWIAGTALPARAVHVQDGAPVALPPPARSSLEVVLRPHPSIWDGRFANVAWLQELPEPLTKVTWENTIWISPALAEAENIATGDHVTLSLGERAVTGPAWIMPGQAEGTVLLHLGYGRLRAGAVGSRIGIDAYALRSGDAPWILPGARIARADGHTELATTQKHFALEGHDFVRTMSAAQLREPPPPERRDDRPPSLYEPWAYPDQAWAMVIDLDLCIGCNACVLACQSENNIPVVGREQVRIGREMHWLRIDRYYEGSLDAPRTHFQPVPCMHCEKAPCEVGCPVNATVHGPDGLNEMIYNRCIGTRTCSSYCPYKVRRFNFLDYTAEEPAPLAALRNPDVTVRARGVMEKCTYCVQRIAQARIAAHKEDRPIRDGEVVTACQAACPTRVIVFGDQNDADSAVAQAKRSPRNYALLEEVNTWPRTTYLAKVVPEREES